MLLFKSRERREVIIVEFFVIILQSRLLFNILLDHIAEPKPSFIKQIVTISSGNCCVFAVFEPPSWGDSGPKPWHSSAKASPIYRFYRPKTKQSIICFTCGRGEEWITGIRNTIIIIILMVNFILYCSCCYCICCCRYTDLHLRSFCRCCCCSCCCFYTLFFIPSKWRFILFLHLLIHYNIYFFELDLIYTISTLSFFHCNKFLVAVAVLKYKESFFW